MVHGETPDGVVAVTQPAHAWVSGQLARAWGNAEFGSFEPREEVCLAAEQHDVGWTAWEEAPERNPETGLPATFRELPLARHLEIWTRAPRLVLAQNRYAALLVSLHGSGLYERRRGEPAVDEFLARERTFQDDLAGSLGVERESVERNRRLVGTWDWLSLLLCGGLARPASVPRVPTASAETELSLTPTGGDVLVSPWPFGADEVVLGCEGRLLVGRFDDEEAMRRALAQAPWRTLRWRLRPGRADTLSA